MTVFMAEYTGIGESLKEIHKANSWDEGTELSGAVKYVYFKF